jgi:hypothetical protein
MKPWLRQNGVTLLLALAAGGCFGAAAVQVGRRPATRQVKRSVDETDLTVQAGFTYEVAVTAATQVWPKGTKLASGRPAYSYAGRPELHVHPVLQLGAGKPATVALTERFTVELGGVTPDEGAVLWQLPLGDPKEQRFTLQPEDRTSQEPLVGPELVVDVLPAAQRLEQIRKELGFMQSANQVLFRLDADVRAEVSGRIHQFAVKAELPFRFSADGFSSIPLEKAAVSVARTATQVTVATELVPLADRIWDQWLWLCGGTGAAVLLLWLQLRRLRVAGASLEHRRFKAWITEGKVNVDAVDVQTAVSNLEGLVDLAIDMNKRVIFDRHRSSYHVLDGGILYTWNANLADGSPGQGAAPMLGEILVESGILKQAQLSQALEYQRSVRRPLGEILIALELVDEMTLYTTLAGQRGLPYLELAPSAVPVDLRWLERLSLQRARLFGLAPLGERPDGQVAVAVANPMDQGALSAVAALLDRPVAPVVTRPSLVSAFLDAAEAGRVAFGEQPGLPRFGTGLTQRDRLLLREGGPGQPLLGLILKASGLVDEATLAFYQAKDQSLRRTLVESGAVHPDVTQLAAAAEEALRAGLSDRAQLDEVTLPDLLNRAARLPLAELSLCRQFAARSGRPLGDVLVQFYLASPVTLSRAERVLAGMGEVRGALGLYSHA